MLPLAFFLVEHLAVNATAIAGREAFRSTGAALDRLPLLPWLEALGIGLPLLVHVTIGVLIAAELPEEGNDDARGWKVWSQRLTGIYLMVYVVFHVWGTRLSPEVLEGRADLFELMRRDVVRPAGFAFHALGVLAAAWHLGFGMPRFVGRWWPGASHAARRAAAGAGVALAILLGVAGVGALAAFAGSAP